MRPRTWRPVSPFETLQARVGDVAVPEAECLEARERLKMQKPRVGETWSVDVQTAERAQAPNVGQIDVGRSRAANAQFLEMLQISDLERFLVAGCTVTYRGQGDIVENSTTGMRSNSHFGHGDFPARDVSSVLVLPIVLNATSRLFDRQDRGSLNPGGANDPAEATGDQNNQDDESARAEPQITTRAEQGRVCRKCSARAVEISRNDEALATGQTPSGQPPVLAS